LEDGSADGKRGLSRIAQKQLALAGRRLEDDSMNENLGRSPTNPTRQGVMLWIRWLFAFGLAAILGAAFSIFGYMADIEGLQNGELSLAHRTETKVSRVLSGRSTAIGFRTSDRSMLFTCYVGICGYDGWERDIDKQAMVLVLNGKIAQIWVDGNLRKSFDDIRKAIDRSLYRGLGLGVLGLMLILIGVVIQQRQK
jgi:hypothetical protein